MRARIILCCAALIASSAASLHAQEAGVSATVVTAEQPVALTARALALDAKGREALSGRLLTTTLVGTPDSPVPNIRLVVENVSPYFYEYVSGRVTFYDSQGVRCGEGLFKFDVLAPREMAETDTPGLRLACTPMSWRVVATNLLTRTSDTAKPNETEPAPSGAMSAPAVATTDEVVVQPLLRFVNLEVDGVVYRVPLNSTVAVPVGRRKIKISITPSEP